MDPTKRIKKQIKILELSNTLCPIDDYEVLKDWFDDKLVKAESRYKKLQKLKRKDKIKTIFNVKKDKR